ncbi:hypothetical protein B0A50_02462 [Salinomyces thailandicus]|uniref:Carboxylic ester hydrolase n=1 Tax=Salinomyces thailandicus TaxID=706561 RepID=A0A4U0U7X5_9PEZI|nr:hypothetical protein B0A50_02462 [Salinomyces thailandica]
MGYSNYTRDSYHHKAGPLGHIEGLTLSSEESTLPSEPVLHYFGGLPYALPPIGPYRFRRARPLPDHYRYGTKASPGRFTGSAAYCPQPGFGRAPDESLWDEDCLQLNIYIPTGDPPTEQGWPVFFYIHGGFLQWGDPNMKPAVLAPLLSETAFQAIVVMPAYRLNALGFLASRELQAEAAQEGGNAGNMGFWDQRLALEWTARNIRHFGGNGGNITVGGYSAGSHSTFQQLAHELYFVPDERAVIKRAIMWSNSPGIQPKALGEHQMQFDELLTALGISLGLNSDEKLRRLREVPAHALIKVQNGLKLSEFRALTDGAFVAEDLTANINSGDFGRRMKKRGIRLMNGECRDEHFLYQAWRTPAPTYDAVYTRLCADYSEPAVRKLMEFTCGPEHKLPRSVESWQDLFGRLYAGMQVHHLERGFCNALVKGGLVPGQDLLRYRFEWRASCVQLPPEWGVTHSTDMAIWFWGEGQGDGLTEEEKAALGPWNRAFADFVSGGEVEWGTSDIREMRRLGGNGVTDVCTDDRWAEGLRVWDLVNGEAEAGVLSWIRSKL